MGEIIVRKVRGMNWKAKIALVLMFTMVFSTFIHQGLYNPKRAEAAIGSGQMVYNNNTTTPQARTYTVSSNTFAAAVATVAGGTPKWVKAVAGTARNEIVVAYSDTSATSTLRILYWNGSSWSSAAPHNWTANLSTAAEVARSFDIAVEKLSGDIIVAYTTNAAGTEINYRRWDGASWSAATGYDSGRLTGTVRFIKMESKPNSDDIGLIMADTNNDLSAAIWNGTANTWGNAPSAALSASAAFITAGTVDAESFDLAYESLSGDLLVAWANDGIATGLYYNTFSAGAWGTTAQYTNMTEAFENVDCASDPLSDKVICAAVGTATQDMRVGVWSGTAWQGNTTDVDTSAAPATFVAGRKYLATGWLNSGAASQGIIVYNDNSANAINWVVVNADGTFTVQTDNTAATPMPVGGIAYSDLIVNPNTKDSLLYIFQDTTNFDIFAKRLIMDSSGTFTWSDANGGAVINAAPTTAASEAFHFAYDVFYNLNVGNGTNPVNLTVGPSSTNNAMDGFTLQTTAGSATVTSLVVTGSANFTSTNIPTNGVKVWRDLGTVGAYDPGVDVQISSASSAIAGNATTVTISNEAVNTTAQNYLVTVDMTATPTNAQSFTGTVTSVTAAGFYASYQDTSSATLTISTTRNLTITNGTNPINKNAQRSSLSNALDGFTMGLTATGSSTVSSLTITGSANFTATNIPTNGVKVWRDTGTTVGYWDAGDTLISSASTAIAGNATTVTISNEPVTSPSKNYLVTVDITAGATLGQSFTATVTAATGTGLGTPSYADSGSATLTVNKLPSTNASCGSCHAYPPLDASSRDGVSGAFVGSHQAGGHQVVCSTCHVAPATETSADFAHRDGNITMQVAIQGGTYSKGTSFAQTNTPTTGTCSNISCHGANSPTPQWGVGTASCTDCHAGSITRAMAPGTLDNVVAEFGLAWGHKKGSRGPVTAADCIVCHLEGEYATQKPSATYHADGNIDLRDPDGAGETRITNIAGASYTFQKFATSYAAGSRTSTGHTAENVDNILTQKFCLACHDNNGATNTTARTSGGTQYMPWGGVNLGANYTVANGAAAAGGVIDAKTQFALTNSSAHPVLGPRNKDFPTPARMAAPYNNFTRAGTSGTKTNGVVLNCFDCHTTGAALTTRTIVAHGNAATLRGTIYVNSPTLCTTCHTGYTAVDTHGAGSAMNTTIDGGENMGTVCQNCHASASTKPARPVPAQDYHGFNALVGGTNWPAPGARPFAFIRNTVTWTDTAYHRPFRSTEFTSGSATCGGGAGGCNVGNGSTRTYTPGGSY